MAYTKSQVSYSFLSNELACWIGDWWDQVLRVSKSNKACFQPWLKKKKLILIDIALWPLIVDTLIGKRSTQLS